MKTKTPFMKLAALAFSISLTLGTVTPAIADGDGSAITGKVSISEKSYFELNDIHLTNSQNGKLAVIGITIHNGGGISIKTIDYWVRLKNKSGSQFSTRVLPSDKDMTAVAPGSDVEMTYYADVNEDTQLQDLAVEFIQWDLNRPHFQRVLGEVSLPNTYSDVTPSGQSSILQIGETDVKASIKKLVSNKNEKYHVPTVYLTLENVGEQAAAVPAYLFSIRTPEGLLYPLEAKGLKDLTVKPRESKEIQLSGTIPVAVSSEHWELVITETDTDLKVNLPIAAFQLPASALNQGGSIGKEYPFTSKSGVYTAGLNALYRLPWEDQDLVSAYITLSNKGPDTLSVPNLSGYFLLDDAVKIDAKAVQTANAVGIASNSSLNLHIVGKVPYTTKFSRIKLVLQEKESDTVTTDVLEFTGQSEMQAIPFHGLDQTYTLSDVGRTTGYKIRSLNRYSSNTGSLIMVQADATNLEKRYTELTKLVAHFRAADGTVLPASVAEIKNNISPNGTALLNISATLPKGFQTENMHLIIGESVTDGKLTSGEQKSDSYVNPEAFALPVEKGDVRNSLTRVELYPYQISMNQFGTSIETNTLTLKFNYEISRESDLQTNVDGHRLVLVFEDSSGQKSFEKSFEMKDIDPVDGETPETAGMKLKLGKHENFKIQVTDADLIYKSSFLKQYKLSLYEEFQGQRRPLATQHASWFITTD